ncbi:NAD(P)H-binding protein [Rhodococcus aerolatus]
MRVVIAGGHGKIAQQVIKALVPRGDVGVGLVRNADHVHELEALGGQAVVIDLESASTDDLAAHLEGADAVVFAAGAGPDSGPERKDSVDRAGSVLLADAAEQAGVRRFVQISSFGAGEEIPEGTSESFVVYLQAKTAAEDDLKARDGLDWTILRPGGLTDDDGTGMVALSTPPLERGTVPREDVAAVVVALLDTPGTAGTVVMLTEGATPVVDAVAALG